MDMRNGEGQKAMKKAMKVRPFYLALTFFSLVHSGCMSKFQGSARVKGGVAGCVEKCRSWGMELDGMVAVGEYTDACICGYKGEHASSAEIASAMTAECEKLKSKTKFSFAPETWANYLSICREYESNPTINDGVVMWVKRLHAARKDVNASDQNGWTPLHYAAYTGYEKLVKYLIKKGADTNIKNNEGKTARDIAVEKGHAGVVDILK
jgi:hypothetical protein